MAGKGAITTQGASTAVRFAGAVETYINSQRARNLSPWTVETAAERLGLFGAYLAGRGLDLRDLNRFVITDYLLHLRDRPNLKARRRPRRLSEHTLATTFNTIHAFARFLTKAGLVKRDFMDGVEQPRTPQLPPVVVPDDVLRSVLGALNPKRPPKNYPPGKWRFLCLRNRAILLVLYDSMVRNAELRALGAEDLDFGDGMILVRRGKGAKSRRVPFGAEAMRAVRQWLAERERRFRLPPDRGVLFLDLSGRPLSKHALRGVFRSMARLVNYAGRFHPHAIRHSAAKSANRAGADLFTLAKVLGHSTLTVTRRYAELDDSEIARQHRIWSPASRLLRG